MRANSEILAKIESQLQDDILHFGWLCQIVGEHHPSFTESQVVDCVVAAVTHLAGDRAVVVGDAIEIDGMVRIRPWMIPQEELSARIAETIVDSKDREFCFWIQLTKHYVT